MSPNLKSISIVQILPSDRKILRECGKAEPEPRKGLSPQKSRKLLRLPCLIQPFQKKGKANSEPAYVFHWIICLTLIKWERMAVN